ncbi:MAG: polyprenyl synthetase family protein [Sutterellaceae bacterium]|nr:polyprenyl synthetase family protein [Sutterellaceae bacterium]
MTQNTSLKQAAMMALAPIAADMQEVERVISEEMASAVGHVEEIARYITSAGGKRMRPALLILMARAMGAEPKLAAYLGAVIEILHTATLMHDDVVDEGKMRRGRETANARWGNGQAVLVGDFLYTRSFQMMIRAGNLKVMQALADAANRLSEGEVLQMQNAHDPDTDEAKYFAVIERKTACLFEAAAHMAAAIAEAAPEQENACAQYALHLGNAFQIADDILDYNGEAAAIGKNLGADLREGKVTLPVLYAMQLAGEADRELIREAIRKGDGDFEAISRIVIGCGALQKCLERAQIEVQRGSEALNALPPGQFRDSLIKFLFLSVQRDR